MSGKKFAVIGGDLRLEYLAVSLRNLNYNISCFATAEVLNENSPTIETALCGADTVILPFPLTPDGVYLSATCDQCHISLTEIFDLAKQSGVKSLFAGAIKPDIYRLCNERDLLLIDYSISETFLLRNALCTAEGALSIAMKELNRTIFASKILIIGYGRIGSMLAKMLSSLGAEVYCAARNPDIRTKIALDGLNALEISEIDRFLPSYDAVFNTVPTTILDKQLLSLINNATVTIDLASSPGGIDFEAAEKLGKRVIWARSLPGKYSPKTAAEIIQTSILDLLKTTAIL